MEISGPTPGLRRVALTPSMWTPCLVEWYPCVGRMIDRVQVTPEWPKLGIHHFGLNRWRSWPVEWSAPENPEGTEE